MTLEPIDRAVQVARLRVRFGHEFEQSQSSGSLRETCVEFGDGGRDAAPVEIGANQLDERWIVVGLMSGTLEVRDAFVRFFFWTQGTLRSSDGKVGSSPCPVDPDIRERVLSSQPGQKRKRPLMGPPSSPSNETETPWCLLRGLLPLRRLDPNLEDESMLEIFRRQSDRNHDLSRLGAGDVARDLNFTLHSPRRERR